MLISTFLDHNYPQVSLSDKVSFALTLLEDFNVLHLPVVDEKKYIGIISKEQLLEADEDDTISAVSADFKTASINEDQHFFVALKLFNEFDISLLPVVNQENELEAVVTQKNLIKAAADYLNTGVPGGIIVLEMDNRNFSSGEINRLVETNDATITQLNSYIESGTGFLIVTIKINKTEVSDVVATLQRYDYSVRNYFGEELFKNELKENYEMLMAYLNI